jgi:uncharacterized membrane protein YebE (DUF533 family)
MRSTTVGGKAAASAGLLLQPASNGSLSTASLVLPTFTPIVLAIMSSGLIKQLCGIAFSCFQSYQKEQQHQQGQQQGQGQQQQVGRLALRFR